MRWCDGLTDATAPRSVNRWLSMRVIAQTRAYDVANPIDVRRDWAAVSIKLTECAARFAGYGSWNEAIDICNMRAFMIRNLSPVPVSEVDALIAFALARLTLRPSAAKALADRWQTLPVDRILLLRRHKNLIAPLVHLADQLPDTADADIARSWINIHRHLP